MAKLILCLIRSTPGNLFSNPLSAPALRKKLTRVQLALENEFPGAVIKLHETYAPLIAQIRRDWKSDHSILLPALPHTLPATYFSPFSLAMSSQALVFLIIDGVRYDSVKQLIKHIENLPQKKIRHTETSSTNLARTSKSIPPFWKKTTGI